MWTVKYKVRVLIVLHVGYCLSIILFTFNFYYLSAKFIIPIQKVFFTSFKIQDYTQNPLKKDYFYVLHHWYQLLSTINAPVSFPLRILFFSISFQLYRSKIGFMCMYVLWNLNNKRTPPWIVNKVKVYSSCK